MKKIFYKILLAMSSFIAGLGFTFMPIVANADEAEGGIEKPEVIEIMPEESVETDSSTKPPEEDNGANPEGIPDGSVEENSPKEDVEEDNIAGPIEDEEYEAPDSSIEKDSTSVDEELLPETEGSKWFDEYIMPLLVGLFAPLGGTLAGGGLLGWLLFKGVKVLKKLLVDAIDGLLLAQKQTETAGSNLTTAKEQMSAWQTEQENGLTAFKATLTEEVKDLITNLQTWQVAQGEASTAREAIHTQELQSFEAKQQEAIQAWQNAQDIAIKQWETNFERQLHEMFNQLQKTMTDKVSDTNTTVHKLLNVEKIAYGDNPVLVSNGTAKKIAEVVDR